MSGNPVKPEQHIRMHSLSQSKTQSPDGGGEVIAEAEKILKAFKTKSPSASVTIAQIAATLTKHTPDQIRRAIQTCDTVTFAWGAVERKLEGQRSRADMEQEQKKQRRKTQAAMALIENKICYICGAPGDFHGGSCYCEKCLEAKKNPKKVEIPA